MKNKRYTIVRVEQQCPFIYEKQDKRAFLNRCLKSDYQCKDCYGDTKEQLEKKVEQALRKKIKEYVFFDYKDLEDACMKDVAKEIVEFLGVE